MKNIYIGPLAGVITGQSIAFTTFVNNSRHQNVVIDINTEGMSFFDKLIFNLKSLCLLILSLFHCSGAVYFTSSRSRVGFFRDFFVVNISKLLFRRRIINHLHGADFLNFRDSLTWIERKILDFTYQLIDVSIVLTPSMAEQYSTLYSNMQVVVVPNCYQQSLLDKKSIHREFFGDVTLKVSYLSNLLKTKGIMELVDAINTLSNNAAVELVIAGKPMTDSECSADEIRSFIEKTTSKQNNIKYVGLLNVSDKADLLMASDVLILPSYYPTEAQPLCLIEGMALGCLLITTTHNYLPELVQHEINGYLVKPRSSEDIKIALQRCLNSPKELEKIKTFNAHSALFRYSQSSYVNAIDNIICY